MPESRTRPVPVRNERRRVGASSPSVLVLALAAVLVAVGHGAGQAPPGDAAAGEWIRPEEVPARADALLRRLEAAEADAKVAASLASIEQSLPKVDRDVGDMLARAAAAMEGAAPPAELEDAQRELTGVAAPLVEWKQQLADEAKRVAQVLDEIAQGERVWTATGSRPETAAAGEVVVRRVATSLAALGQAATNLQAWRVRVLAANDRVIERVAAVDGTQEKLRTALERERASLLVPDRPPLWARGVGGDLGRELPRVPAEILAYADSTLAYVARDPRPLVVQLLVAVLLMLALGHVSRRALGLMAGQRTTSRAARVLERPYAIALLVTLLASPVFHPLAPRRFMQIAALLALFPTARIVVHASERASVAPFVGLFVLLILDRLRSAVQTLPALERATFLLTLATAFGLALAVSRSVRRDGAGPWVRRTARVALLALAAALVAEIGGWTDLATLLGRAIIAGAIAGLYVYAAALGLATLLAYALASRTVRRSRLLETNAALLQRRAAGVLRWVGVAVWLYLMATALGLRGAIQGAAAALLGASISVGALSLSVGGVLAFVVTLIATLLLARVLTAVLEEDVYPRTRLPRGVPYALSTLIRYGVYALGFLFAIAAAGVRLDQVTIMLGGLGIGIGLGLQDLVKNFAAGLTLLFERRVHVGDVLEMPSHGIFGRVVSIGTRASVVRSWSGAEVVVPNSDLVSSAITNWTLSDRLCRVEIPVGVAYGTDPDRVIALLRDAAADVERLLTDPPPQALFKGFGESSLDFILRAWTDLGYEQALPLTSELALSVHRRLRDAGVTIPFPQRDLHLASVSAAARAALSGEPPR